MSSIFFALATLKARLQDADKERGATAVEYGIMVALIAVVIIAAVLALGGQLNGIFEGVGNQLPGGAGGGEEG
ncbi:Flp family type IVb pilin [Serinicoccus sp. LYQ131]|uniref:Flp family type IVb pilin n=1 Tax=Serinicoccus sp. LYQ131 TaxID=3378797 RepID=UPI003853FA3E